MLNRSNLHHYQERAVGFVHEKHGAALFLDMGLGKSIITLTALQEMYDNFEIHRILVICPLRVANVTWGNEIAKWEHTKDLDYAIATGTKKQKIEALEKEAAITITNRESVAWLINEYYKNGRDFPFDTVVIDESSSFKSSQSKRFKALKKVMKKVNRTILLTGTPASNGYMDLWSQIYLLDGGGRLGFNISMYRSAYFNSDFMGYTYTLKHGAMKQIQDRIKDVVLSMDAKDYLEIPDYLSIVMGNKLSGKLLKEYTKFENDALLAVGDETLTAVSAAVLTNKLLQFCSGNVYGEEVKGKRPVMHFHDLKLDTLDEIVEANPEENLLIAYNYKHSLVALQKKYPDAVVMDKEGKAIEAWNRGEIGKLLVHPKSASAGLNLQDGGSMLVWYDHTWSLEEYQQMNARLHRQGQKDVVRIIHIVVGRAEEKLARAISRKDATQAELLSALK